MQEPPTSPVPLRPAGSEPAPAETVPGRVLLSDLARALQKIPARELVTRSPYLLLLGNADERSMGTTTSAFGTLSPDAPAAGSTSPKAARYAYAIEKRQGANAFAHMVTLGRAKNNDLVVPEGAVSKFHASFTRGADGLWQVTDASSNGTWLDGNRLPQSRPHPLRSGSTIALSQVVRLLFLSAEDLLGYLGTGRAPAK